MKRRNLFHAALATGVSFALPAIASPAAPLLKVYKNPYCGCCGAWAEHMKSAGFRVQVELVDDTGEVRRRVGVPDRLGSCHTAVVDGYALEGHVPAEDAWRLLRQRPDAAGLSVPAMPVGSPGMESGARRDPFDVYLIDRRGRATVFASHPKS